MPRLQHGAKSGKVKFATSPSTAMEEKAISIVQSKGRRSKSIEGKASWYIYDHSSEIHALQCTMQCSIHDSNSWAGKAGKDRF